MIDYRAECFGKTSYATKAAAIERIRCQQKRRKTKRKANGWASSVHLAPYRCRHCHQWHVGGTDDSFSKDKWGRYEHRPSC